MKSEAPISDPGRPFVFVNMAMTADGKIATANRAVHSFGSARDQAHLYELRATADAVMCGARTVEISGSRLDAGGGKFQALRLRRGLAEHPLRVVVSGRGSLRPDSPLFRDHFSPLLILTTRRAAPEKLDRLQRQADAVKICGDAEIHFRSALRWLRTRWGVKRLLCEGGGELNDALFRAGLVDEIHLTICPRIFGGRAAPTIAEGTGFPRLAQAAGFQIQSVRRRGDELFTVFCKHKI